MKQMLLVLVLLFIPRDPIAEIPPSWRVYTNVRFQYAVCYPEEFQAQGESTNSDGERFIGRHGELLIAFGGNALGHTLREMQHTDATRFTGDDGKITYEKSGDDWYVISGHNKGTIFYSKTYKSKDQFKSIELSYNEGDQPRNDEIVKHINRCFTDLAKSKILHF